MKHLLICAAAISVALLGLSGCKKDDAEAATATPTNPKQDGPPGIAPLTTAPIAGAPISGAESVAGGGSGVGQVMKERAKGIGQNQPSNVNPEDEGAAGPGDGAVDGGY